MSKLGIKTTIFLIPVMAVLVLFSAGSIHAQSEINIPDWVKNTALWWAEGSLTDQDFVNALQYLITNGIITIPNAINTEVIENEPSIDLAQSELNIPDWVKNTALWWAEGTLTDQDFVNALQYLITNGIITIPGSVITDQFIESRGNIHPDAQRGIVTEVVLHNNINIDEDWFDIALFTSSQINVKEKFGKVLESLCPVGSTIYYDVTSTPSYYYRHDARVGYYAVVWCEGNDYGITAADYMYNQDYYSSQILQVQCHFIRDATTEEWASVTGDWFYYNSCNPGQ